ncbi:flagellar biosynthesis anti-sigma factor FlgM [Aidingimonas lacisalsi]|uniref:flagellar biosynthesis anti-sigma factor FlgM n=1 Tax=Aidingimonas lacisalsi TaxID=2604086 RepID=UPI0011D1DDC1|nr:flagellar biosynthesis anti-sigma factor FlgM [Aidingimonas lacisalsi]
MKIDSTQPLTRPDQQQNTEKTQESRSKSETTDASSPAAMTHLGQNSGDASQDIDGARVEEIRQAISDGRLEIRADKIADGLIDSVRDLLGQSSSE